MALTHDAKQIILDTIACAEDVKGRDDVHDEFEELFVSWHTVLNTGTVADCSHYNFRNYCYFIFSLNK